MGNRTVYAPVRNVGLLWPDKDDDEVLDYSINFAKRLRGDTISSATWTFPTGLTEGASSETYTTATVWISGGTTGAIYDVLCQIATSGGRTFEQTVAIKISDR